MLAGTHGLALLLSGTAPTLARSLTATEAAELMEIVSAMLAAVAPPATADIANHIEGLALHYPVLRRNGMESRIVAQHWADDLKDLPSDLIGEACRLWRNSPADKFPTPGQLKKLVEDVWSYRQNLARRAQEFARLRGEQPDRYDLR